MIGLAVMLLAGAAAAQAPLVIAKQGYFFVGGTYFDTQGGQFMSGQMYVEFQIPAERTHPYPIVMFSGGGQSGLNYSGTPDGREGWMQYFLRQGYAVYVLDQPSRARSPHQPEAGPQARNPVERIQQRFTAPERSNLWPQATLHTQWPGAGVAGDAVFDQFFAQNYPSLVSFPRQQELNRDAGAALLDRIGSAILLTHSQSGTFGWLVADARPALVIRQEKPDAPDLIRCWTQAEPARTLVNLKNIPVLVVQAEASYHAAYDHCTAAYLRQARVSTVRFVRLADAGIKGNGHMLMLEKNNLDIAALAERWLRESVERPLGAVMPDFSGEWILNRQASTLSPGADNVKSGVWRIEHREPTFRIEASFVTATDPIQFQYELQSDGREVVATQQGLTSTSSLRWDGNALVVVMRIQRPGSDMTISFRYELVDGGRGLRAVEQLRGTDHDQDNVWVFERR